MLVHHLILVLLLHAASSFLLPTAPHPLPSLSALPTFPSLVKGTLEALSITPSPSSPTAQPRSISFGLLPLPPDPSSSPLSLDEIKRTLTNIPPLERSRRSQLGDLTFSLLLFLPMLLPTLSLPTILPCFAVLSLAAFFSLGYSGSASLGLCNIAQTVRPYP